MQWHGRVSKQCERSRFTNRKVDIIGRGGNGGGGGRSGGGGRGKGREGLGPGTGRVKVGDRNSGLIQK